VCSVYKKTRKNDEAPDTDHLIAVYPKRFFEVDFLHDVSANCWVGDGPLNLNYAYEVKMSSLGTVDFVLAELSENMNRVERFVSVELQAVDITGSYLPAYLALVQNQLMDRRPVYNFNWANVRKRYITQLINKGFFHHHWGTRIVSVLQDHVFERLSGFIKFDELPVERANIVFTLYKFVDAPEKGDGCKRLVFDRTIGTSHNSLMMAALYSKAPGREEFCERILHRLDYQ